MTAPASWAGSGRSMAWPSSRWSRRPARKSAPAVMPQATASGRTDAGVHALGQIVQMDLPAFPPHRLREALNYHMKPHPVVVLRAAPAPAGWNARFSAISRTYRYVISNRPAPPAVEASRVWHVRQRLDEAAMQRAAKLLLGHHDFSSFRASACQAKSPMRTLRRADRHPPGRQTDRTRQGAQLFAPSGAQHGRLAENGRGGKLARNPASPRCWRPKTAPWPARPPRPRDSIWSASVTKKICF